MFSCENISTPKPTHAIPARIVSPGWRKHRACQIDATIHYIIADTGGEFSTDIDSPYNTYKYPGLPVGPIANPGLASLRAAAAPATTPYLYFVARNDGSHVFSTTNEEHNRNVEKYQRQYFRDKRKAAAGR